ncbi:MAG: putative lipid II flippase FtsW [Clostridia bacterium]|jgi:cell division protein ftsW|nr:putative lipid II flippase FtsW [Clostridiales bacterium]
MTKNKKTVPNFINNQFDFILFVIIIILLSLGIVMVLSASAPSAIAESGNSYSYVIQQLKAAILGIILMLIISKIDYRLYKKFYKAIYWISVLILLLVLIPGLGLSSNGATRWIDLKFIQFQPSELTKIGLIVFYAGYLADHKSELKSFWKGFVKPLIYILPPIAILYFVQNHLSASVVIGAVTCVMMIMAGCRLLYFVIAGLIGALVMTVGIIALQATGKGGFRIKRIMSFMDPWADATEVGWQAVQGLYAIGSGGLFGVGLGESKQKYLYIPEPHNDFIFSILAEELGFVGCVIVILLFAIFIWRGILIAIKSPDMFGSLLATGITTLIGVQVIINIGVVTSSIPNTGMPLPFFSYGGTALLILLCSCGVLLNISRAGSKV